MFEQKKFSEILNRIVKQYDSISDFAKISTLGRSYISKYINLKIDSPPSPKILEKIANHSKNITTYDELMEICGYINYIKTINAKNSLNDPSKFYVVPILFSNNGILYKTNEDVSLPNNIDFNKQYFGYRSSDDSMLPLLGTGDVAIVEKIDTFKSGQTCLISLDNNSIIIRKIIDFKEYIELHTAFPYGQPMKLTKEDMKSRDFKILGRIIKAEIQSAFR